VRAAQLAVDGGDLTIDVGGIAQWSGAIFGFALRLVPLVSRHVPGVEPVITLASPNTS